MLNYIVRFNPFTRMYEVLERHKHSGYVTIAAYNNSLDAIKAATLRNNHLYKLFGEEA